MSDAKPTFDEMLHTTHERWADVERRLAEIIDLVHQGSDRLWLVIEMTMLRDDVAKWRREAKEDYEAF